MFLKVYNVGAERMSSGILFQTTGPACRVFLVFVAETSKKNDDAINSITTRTLIDSSHWVTSTPINGPVTECNISIP